MGGVIYDWKQFRVYIPDKGFKLVHELSQKEAKDSLCSIIELVETLASKNEECLNLINLRK